MMHKRNRLIVIGAAAVCAVLQMPLHAAADELDGWQSVNGKRYFYQDGEAVTGEVYLDGMPYLFAPNGVQQVGWQTVDGKRYYYNQDGTPVFGWVFWRGEMYYVSEESGKLTGEQIPDESAQAVSFDDYGVVQHGWMQDADGAWIYKNEFGEILTGEIEADGTVYLLDGSGRLLTGWQTASDGITRYYETETHAVRTGWIELEGMRYYADADAGRLTGLQTLPDGSVHYFDEAGVLQSGLIEADGAVYLFLEDGSMYTGLYSYQGSVRFFGEDGKMQTGFVTLEDGTRYFNESGLMQRGLYRVGEDTYYFDSSGVMNTGWISVGSMRYWAAEDGRCVTDWQEIDGLRYYFDASGYLCTTSAKIGDDVYVFDSEGQTVSGWYTAASGKTYFCDEDGIAAVGWQEIGDYGYYFHDNGVMAVSATVEGFTIDAQGHARSEMAVTVDNLLTNTTKTPMSIYKYIVSNYRYSRIEATRTYAQLHAAGWDSLVQYTLKNRRGVCYYLAATMDYYLQRAGYTTRLVHATHSTGNHYWNQVLVDGVWQNYDPTYSNRGDLPWATQIALGNYTVLGYVQVHYDARGAYLGDTYS